MKCPTCDRAELESKRIDIVDNWKGQRVIVKDVPADVCPMCGEHVYTGDVADRINGLIRASVGVGVEVVIRRYVSEEEEAALAATA